MALYSSYPNNFSSNFGNFYPQNNQNLNAQYALQDYQNMRDKIDKQMQQLQQSMVQQQQPPAQVPQVNQTFQLAPNKISDIDVKVVKDIEEVKAIFTAKLGIFVNADYSKLWVKDDYGNIREFDTSEVIEIDEKDKTIIEMQQQLGEKDKDIIYMREQIEYLKGVIENATDKSTGVDTKSNETTTKQKSTSVSKSK